jgi:hypothetical protein
VKEKNEGAQLEEKDAGHHLERILYNRFYQKLVFGEQYYVRVVAHSLIWAIAFLLLGLGLFGISSRNVGIALQDFLPPDHQAHLWATAQSELLGTWTIKMNWPDLNYTDPDTQMKMIRQFESVLATPHVEDIDTR